MATKRNFSDIAVNIVVCILIIIALPSLFAGVLYIYFKVNPDKLPETHVTSYVSTIVDENGVERQFIEVEYWENLDGRGKQVIEISFNAYSGQDATHVRRMGVQYSFDLNGTTAFDISQTWNYTQDGGASWKSLETEQIDVGTPMYIKIDDDLYSVTMDGTYIEYSYNFNFTKGVSNFFKWLFVNETYKLNINDKSFGYTVTETVHPYTMTDFYTEVLSSVLYNNVGYGSNILSLVDLSKFFTIKKRTGTLGEFVPIENYQEHENEYFSIKVTRHRDGLMRAKDSVFGMYRGDTEYTLIETDTLLNEYAGIDDNVILTYQDFEYRFCPEYGGYVAYLKNDMRNTLSSGHIDTVAISLDLSNAYFRDADFPVIGIMYDFANISSVVLTFDQQSFPQFYEFYDKAVGRKFIPVDAQYIVFNRANQDYTITHFGEVEI